MSDAEEVATKKEEQTILNSRLIERFEPHRDFTKVFLDAFVLLDSKRQILRFNQMFCSILGLRAVDVRRARTIDELLNTEMQGSNKTAIDLIMESTAPQRIDEIQAKKVHCDEVVQLIMGSYPYFDDDSKLIGACVVIRDVTAESNLQGKYKERTIQSVTDPLTGLFTRRYFEDWIDRELERCRKNDLKPALGLLMFDLDKFKTINDTYGHQAGDFVLQETAKVLRDISRKTDIVGRYGGEEMLVVLIGANSRGSCIAAEKFRQAIQNHTYTFNEVTIPVTASVGVSIFLDSRETRLDVVKRSDACLYSAKHAGRNVSYANFGDGDFKVSDYLEMLERDAPSTTKSEAS